jgi:SAM-dependent methyltransferase
MEVKREETTALSGIPASSEIRKRLDGVVRTDDIHVELDNHHYIVLSQLYGWMQKEALPVAQGVLLDYGCGGQTYRKLFEPKVKRYIGADDPDFYLQECYRVLRSGGILILTAPMQWRHHEVPYDFFRFTKYGLIEVLKRSGLEITSIASTGGVYSLLGQIFRNHLAERGIQRKHLFRCINRLALWLDRKVPDPEDTLNWMCIACNRM